MAVTIVAIVALTKANTEDIPQIFDHFCTAISKSVDPEPASERKMD